MTPIRVNLRTLRKARRLTQQALGERAGVRQATISDLEAGRTKRIGLDVIERLCAALGVQPGHLLERRARRQRGD